MKDRSDDPSRHERTSSLLWSYTYPFENLKTRSGMESYLTATAPSGPIYHGYITHIGQTTIHWPIKPKPPADIAWWAMMRWIVGSILFGGPIEHFSYQPVLHDWCNKGRGMYYLVYRMVHIKDPLLLIGNSIPYRVENGFPLLISESSFTIMSDAI